MYTLLQDLCSDQPVHGQASHLLAIEHEFEGVKDQKETEQDLTGRLLREYWGRVAYGSGIGNDVPDEVGLVEECLGGAPDQG